MKLLIEMEEPTDVGAIIFALRDLECFRAVHRRKLRAFVGVGYVEFTLT